MQFDIRKPACPGHGDKRQSRRHLGLVGIRLTAASIWL
jgi:hypothetical protein